MAEKRVSVRLVVEGGRVVRAELDGVGAAGERAFDRIERSGDAVGGMMRRVAGLFAAGFSLASIGRAAEQFNQIENSLRTLGLTQDGVNSTMDRLTDIALATGAPLEAVAGLYQRVSMAAEDLGVDQQQLFGFIEATASALAVQGGSAANASGALLQLGQALGGGIVRAEEWNSIIEGAPALARAAAAGWGAAGVSVAELGRQVREGTVSSDAFFQAILSQQGALAQTLANTELTVGRAMTNLTTSFTVFVGEMDNATGASTLVAQGIQTLAENLDVAGSIAAGLVATQIPALVAGLRAVGIAGTLAGGPLGLVIGLVAAGASYFLLFRDNANEVPEPLQRVREAQETLNTALGAFANTGAPEAGRQAIGYARALETQARAALAAAEAQIALIEAETQQRIAAAGRYTPGGWTPDPAITNPELEAVRSQAAGLRATIQDARQTVFDLRDSVSSIPGATVPPLAETTTAVEAVTEALAGAGRASREATDQALAGWQAVGAQLANFATEAADVAGQVGSVMTSGMKRLEDAILDAFKGGTGGARAFFAYIAEEIARVAIRNTIIAPISGWLGRTLGGLFGGGATAAVLHTGGLAGAGGASRAVDPAIFAAAPRYHSGGIAGLAPDEIPAILQRGERVIPRGQSGDAGAQTLAITVNVQGANGDQHVIDLVQQGVSAGISALNNALPTRVQQIINAPRKQGW